jgi:hypothetical protein
MSIQRARSKAFRRDSRRQSVLKGYDRKGKAHGIGDDAGDRTRY